MATIKTYRLNGPMGYDDIDDNFDNLNNSKIERTVTVNDSVAGLNITQNGTGSGLVVNTNEFVVDPVGKVGVGTATPSTSLDLSSKTDGISIPSGTTAQRPSVTTPTLRHNTTLGMPEYLNAGVWSALSSGISNIQVFTSNGTFTVPAGVTRVKVTVIGGGGNGGGASGNSSSGGGAGGTAIKVISGLTAGATVAVTVGAAGGTSSFGSYCSASGGAVGSNGAGTAGGAGGIGSNGDLNIKGQSGFSTSSTAIGGNGGSSTLGGGGRGNPSGAGEAGGSYGGGGAGGSTSVPTGGAGASGVVIVEY